MAFDAGVYVNAVAYPAVPRGQGVLRLSVMATHTERAAATAGAVIAEAVERPAPSVAARGGAPHDADAAIA